MTDLVGICGFARTGKNSFADFIAESNSPVKTLSFAYALRKELEGFVEEKIGISTFTEDPEEKEIIRPLLVCWGTEVIRKQIDPDYWIKKIEKSVEINRKRKITSIITDVRFQNEVEWINKAGGVTIFIEREGVGPRNSDEQSYTLPLRDKCDFVFGWPTFRNFEINGKKAVKEFLINSNNLCHLITPTSNLQTTLS